MLKIKFSHNYYKLPVLWDKTSSFFEYRVVLIGAVRCPDIQAFLDKYKSFKVYDTLFIEGGKPDFYPIEFKDGIILTFMWPFEYGHAEVFTTIRRYTPDKMQYYQDNILQEFIMVKSEE